MKISVKLLEEMKVGDILTACIKKELHGLVVDFNIEWHEGVPYEVSWTC